MNNTKNIIIAEWLLRCFNIHTHEFVFPEGKLFFCSTVNGLTFDLLIASDGLIKIWRFIDGNTVKEGDFDLVPNHIKKCFSVGNTCEGDLCLLASDYIDGEDTDILCRIYEIVICFIMVAEMLEQSSRKN